MLKNLGAYTAPGSGYPGFVSINVAPDGDVTITVRSPASTREGVHVCSHSPSPGRCTPGGPTCNNYCNLAPAKGPMQNRPLDCTHVDAGAQAAVKVPAADWAQLLEQLAQ